MAERESLPEILRRWETIGQDWEDRASAKLLDTCLNPLEEQSKLLLEQHEEIDRFLSRMEAELEELQIHHST